MFKEKVNARTHNDISLLAYGQWSTHTHTHKKKKKKKKKQEDQDGPGSLT